MKTKVRTTKLSFSKAELGGIQDVSIGQAGMQIGRFTKPTIESFNRTMQFGLFGNVSHNANVYDPNVTLDSIMPRPEDFIDVPFRFISAAVVGGNSWKATDFSDVVSLQASIEKLNGKPVYPNHEPELYNFLGVVADPYWDSGKLTKSGLNIPPGINGMMRIDAKTNPKIARGLLMGALFSNSVTVSFDWVPSHSFDNEELFEEAIGTYSQVDGKMVTRKVTKIHDFFETSLVWLGADPFAKMLDANGDLVHVDASSICFSKASDKEREIYKAEKKYNLSVGIDKNILSLSKERLSKPIAQPVPKEKINMKFLTAFLAALAGVYTFKNTAPKEGEEMSTEFEAELLGLASKLSLAKPEDATQLAMLNKFVTGLTQVNDKGEKVPFVVSDTTPLDFSVIAPTELTRVYGEAAKVPTLAANAKIGETYIAAKKAECIRQYGLAVKGVTEPAVIELINNATPAALDGLIKTYAKGLTEEFTAFCKTCNSSDNVEMRSSISGDDNPADDATEGFSTDDFREKYGQSSLRIGR